MQAQQQQRRRGKNLASLHCDCNNLPARNLRYLQARVQAST